MKTTTVTVVQAHENTINSQMSGESLTRPYGITAIPEIFCLCGMIDPHRGKALFLKEDPVLENI